MGSGTVTIGRRVYAVGLYWENSPTGRVVQAAREAAQQPGQQAEYYAIRTGVKDERIPQFGLGQSSAGHKSGMPAFAACLANQQTGSWAGAFRVREGTIVAVVRDDLILPDGDQLFLNESEARDRLLQEVGFGGLQRIYAPEAWAISGADSMPVSLLINERHDVTLRSVRVSKQFLVAVGAVGFLALCAVGVGAYLQLSHEEPQPVPVAPVPIPLHTQTPEYPPPDKKWEKQPVPMKVVEACQVALGKVPAVVAGWQMVTLSCSTAALSISWSRLSGASLAPEGAVVDVTGNSASKSIPFDNLPSRGPQELWDQKQITDRYINQDWPGTISRMEDDPLPPPPPDYQGSAWNPPSPPWVKRSFTLTVSELPGSLPGFIGDIPGVIVNSLSFTGGSIGAGGWKVDGVIYENRNSIHN